jgi:ATP-dependent helicase/nuclease subunit A
VNNIEEIISKQQIASNPQNSAWVFASAGSGKTKILTDRVIRLLLSGVYPGKIICLTFTKAGANEMLERINSRLAEFALMNNESLQENLQNLTGKPAKPEDLTNAKSLLYKILDDENKLKIQTIHSFCQNLIKIFPFEAGIKPNFEIIEENKEKILLSQAKNNVIAKSITDQNLQKNIKFINQKLTEDSISEIISKLLDKKEDLKILKNYFGNSEIVTNKIYEKLVINKGDNNEKIFKDFLNKVSFEDLKKLGKIFQESKVQTNVEHAKKIDYFTKNPIFDNFTQYIKIFFTQSYSKRKLIKATSTNLEVLRIVEQESSNILDFIDISNSHKIAFESSTLLNYIFEILDEYQNIKNQNSLLDYNDLIVETNRLLANPDHANWIKKNIDGNCDHILVDESQDTNLKQWNIIKALCEDFFSGESDKKNQRSIFIVGDEKQSIFSFQGADPNISNEVFHFFEEKLGNNLKKIELNNSFRSTKEILEFVDQVFANEKMAKAISKISEFKNHKAVRSQKGKVEIWPVFLKNKESEENLEDKFKWNFKFLEEEKEKNLEILAEFIALKIKERVTKKEILTSRNREIKYSDFMILLRNKSNGLNQALVKYFNHYQIPFFSKGKNNFSKELIIQDFISLAKFTLFKNDDLNLAALLKSPFFQVSEEEILEISILKKENSKSFFEIISENETHKKLLDQLNFLTKLSKENSLFEFYYKILNEDLVQKNFINEFGSIAKEIIEKFLIFTSDFNDNLANNLQKFLEFVEKIDPEISNSAIVENAVQILTIHSSKGLQAPIVIIPDCFFNHRKLKAATEKINWFNFDDYKLPIYCSKKENENLIVKKFRELSFTNIKEEFLRLLYVAMTRSEDELYIGGFGDQKDSENWYNIVKNSSNLAVEEFDVFYQEYQNLKKNFLPKNENKEIPKENKIINFSEILQNTKDDLDEKLEEEFFDRGKITGKIIHEIFEFFGKNFDQENKEKSKNFLKEASKNILNKNSLLLEDEKLQLVKICHKFLSSKIFDELFLNNYYNEFEVGYKNKLYRIDLVIFKKEGIVIIDYKSDKYVKDENYKKYLKQIKNYQEAISKIYPNKEIKLAILWTDNLELEFIN